MAVGLAFLFLGSGLRTSDSGCIQTCMYLYPCLTLSTCRSIFLSIYIPIDRSIYRPIDLSKRSIDLSIYLSIYLPISWLLYGNTDISHLPGPFF